MYLRGLPSGITLLSRSVVELHHHCLPPGSSHITMLLFRHLFKTRYCVFCCYCQLNQHQCHQPNCSWVCLQLRFEGLIIKSKSKVRNTTTAAHFNLMGVHKKYFIFKKNCFTDLDQIYFCRFSQKLNFFVAHDYHPEWASRVLHSGLTWH